MLEVQLVVVVVLAAVSAVIDWRTGEIPNWLTLPPLVIAPLAYLALGGGAGLAASIAGMLVCGLVPYILFRQEAIGGGDVKLFASIGAVGGLYLGIEAQLFSFAVATVFALGLIAWQGSLRRTLATCGRILINPLLPRRLRRPVDVASLTALRLGPAILVGTIIASTGN